ncbi:hypothetical protein RvY_09014 [Ramazzottius varieornatus]|uniref:Uncharacterized protein n=1 Tax=Ramazzottius varieornatus TaxID=947166 RepID=A0A1D1VH22_RAMVA|nr:hypothetical protein RvY_09014 [Ramazzottius varieornatus]
MQWSCKTDDLREMVDTAHLGKYGFRDQEVVESPRGTKENVMQKVAIMLGRNQKKSAV